MQILKCTNSHGESPVVMGINTTTSALLYKHAFMATWLEWWTVVVSSARTWMGDPGFLQWYRGWVGSGLLYSPKRLAMSAY